MNIYKRAKLRNLTNGELEKLLKELNLHDKDLLREYEERKLDGRIEINFVIPNSMSHTNTKDM